MDDETKSLINLNLIQGIYLNLMQGMSGSNIIQRLVEVFGSAEEALKASSEEIEDKLYRIDEVPPAGLITRLHHYPLEKELELINKHGCHIITFYDQDYPEHLKMIDSPPIVLYVKGELKPIDTNSITIVGPRKPTSYSGRRFSRKVSTALAKEGMTVVSGLAKGIDTYAHRGALDAGGRTLAVMGRGLSRIYPSENEKLADEIAKSGALISELPMDLEPESTNFPYRNRIISGLSIGTVVVEAPNKSGSWITAEEALNQERKVFVSPCQISPDQSSSCNEFIEKGTARFDTVDDMVNALIQLRNMKIPYRSVESTPVPSKLFELSASYREENEEKVKSEVIKYFRRKFPGVYIKLEHQIKIDDKYRRADIALINSKLKVPVVVECKRRGIAETEQIRDYLYASDGTNFGLFANTIEQEFWTFYRKTYNKELKQYQSEYIDRTEFEKGVIEDINSR